MTLFGDELLRRVHDNLKQHVHVLLTDHWSTKAKKRNVSSWSAAEKKSVCVKPEGTSYQRSHAEVCVNGMKMNQVYLPCVWFQVIHF